MVAQPTVTPYEYVVCDRLTEYFDLEDVGNDFFGFPVDIGMDECYVVVTRDDVPECGETFFDTLDRDCVGERVAQVLEFLIGRGGRDEESMSVPCDESTDDSGTSDRGLDDGDDVS